MSRRTVTMPTAYLREKAAKLAGVIDGLGVGIVDARTWQLDQIEALAEAILAEVQEWRDNADEEDD